MHEERHALVLLELLHQRLSLADRRLAVQDEARPAEDRFEKRRQRCGHLAELREDEHLLLLRRDDLGDLAQPAPACRCRPRATSRRPATATGDCRSA